MGDLLQGHLYSLAEHAPIDNIRGRGLMIAFDLPDRESRDKLLVRALEERLLVLPCGSRSIRLRPYLAVTEPEVTALVERLSAALGVRRAG
jgi:L-lysine 6-transaminase